MPKITFGTGKSKPTGTKVYWGPNGGTKKGK
jgi:hypothetical protein